MIKKMLKKVIPTKFIKKYKSKLTEIYKKYRDYKILNIYFKQQQQEDKNTLYLIAIGHLNKQVSQAVNNKMILSMISMMSQNTEKKRIETALFIERNLVGPALMQFATSLIKNGMHAEASHLIKRLHSISPNNVAIIKLYSEALSYVDDSKSIENLLENLRKKNLYEVYVYVKANYFIINDDFNSAKSFLDDAIEFYPTFIISLAPLYKLLNDYDGLWNFYTAYTKRKFFVWNIELIEIALKSKNNEYAENMILMTLKRETNKNTLKRTYSLYIDMLIETCREKQYIFKIIKSAIKNAPYEFKYYQRLIELEEESATILNLTDKMFKLKPSYFIIKGRTYLALNDTQSAIKIFKRAYSIFPTNDRIIFWYAHSLSYHGKCEQAEKYFLMALSTEFHASTLIDYFRHLFRCEKYDKCKLLLEKYSFILSSKKYKIQTQTLKMIYYFGILDIEKAWKSFEDRNSTASFKKLSVYNNIKFSTNMEYFDSNQPLLLVVEYGPGDEIRWSTIYKTIKEQYPNLSISCEPRLYELLKNTFKDINFIPTRRWRRGFLDKTHLSSYTDLPNMQMQISFDNNLWNYINATKPNVMFLVDCLKKVRKDVKAFAPPREHNKLMPREEKTLKWNNYLLSNGYNNKPIIGVSWRSSFMSYTRDLHYFDKQDIIDIINRYKNDFNFFNLQYDECDKELNEIYKKTGVQIINPKTIDQKEDLEDVAAIMLLLDMVIAPATTVVEMAGAVGTTTFLYNNSAELNWRVLENDKDIWHRSITHFYSNEDLISKIENQYKKEKDV